MRAKTCLNASRLLSVFISKTINSFVNISFGYGVDSNSLCLSTCENNEMLKKKRDINNSCFFMVMCVRLRIKIKKNDHINVLVDYYL